MINNTSLNAIDWNSITISNNGNLNSDIIYTTTTTGTNISPLVASNIRNNSLDVIGDANFEGDLKLQGKSLVKTLESIEKRLAILHPNKELEEKWERLKAIGDMYRELEQEIIEQEKVYEILNNS